MECARGTTRARAPHIVYPHIINIYRPPMLGGASALEKKNRESAEGAPKPNRSCKAQLSRLIGRSTRLTGHGARGKGCISQPRPGPQELITMLPCYSVQRSPGARGCSP